jgi:hypothetical protein
LKLRIIPYKKGSQSAKLLAQGLTVALGYKVWRGPSKPFSLNLSWGCHQPAAGKWINNPLKIHAASNKLSTFQALEAAGVSHVPYTSSKEVAEGWSKDGATVFARTVQGQSGSGITIVNPGEAMPNMPLYTRYTKKRKEFRVHVVKGEAIDVQQKKRKNGSDKDVLVWNHSNDYVFCHNDVEEPKGIRELGVAAVAAVGLDFGAVDIIWNQYLDKCFVLEVNTAPGLCETTCGKYVKAFVSKYSPTTPVSTHLQAKVQ